MYSTRTILIAVATLTLVPVTFYGQVVDPSVPAYDPSVNASVQDPDHPDSALLPGGSAAWTGQPIMSQAATSAQPGSARGNQFPSLTPASWWAGVSTSALSASSGSASLQSTNVAQDRNQMPGASKWTRLTGTRKRNRTLVDFELQSQKTNRSTDEFSTQQNESSDPKAKLRMLRRAGQRTARVRTVNPFQNSADATTSGRWHGSLSSASALEQRRHEEALLVMRGYNAQTERRRRRSHRHSAAPRDSR